jgi:hypothetical protein
LECSKLAPVGEENCSRCGRLRCWSGAEVGDGVEDEIDVGRVAGVVTGLRVGIWVGDGVFASGGEAE